jgi:hypothetical protein
MRILGFAVVLCLMSGGIAFAQQLPPPPAPNIDSALIAGAIQNHQWALLAAIVIYALTAAMKQGWLGSTLAKLPKRVIPLVPTVLGVVCVTSGELIGHQLWPMALANGLLAGFAPILGHELLIESARGGKEVVPKRIMNGSNPPVVASVRHRSSAPPPGAAMVALALFLSFSLAAWVGSSRSAPDLIPAVGCTPAERQEAKTIIDWVLSGAQLFCIEQTNFTTSAEVAQACKIDLQASPDVQSYLDQLLAQKAAAMKAGFAWKAPQPQPVPRETRP